MNNTNPNPTTYTTWVEFYGDEPVPAPDDAHERRTEERDAWLNDEADRLEYEAEAKAWDVEDEHAVKCDGCGIVVDAIDAVTDDAIVLCGSYRGNGCADKPNAWDYEDA